jgi:hypothetical protein
LIVEGIDVDGDITDFVQWKIESLCAQGDDKEVEGKDKILILIK